MIGEIAVDIKIITCQYAYNYGAVLQAYALCRFLNENGHDTKVINYRPWYYRGSTKTTNKIKLALRKVIRIPDNFKAEKVFYGFLKRCVPLTAEYKSYADLSAAKIQADLFIAGSDQIWNFDLPNGTDAAFYLKFVQQGKKASYAASLGMDAVSDEQATYLKERLSHFDGISVREKSAKGILENAGLQNVRMVADPVYLLKKEEWAAIAKKPDRLPAEKYILIYAFNRQKHIFEFGAKLARKYGYKLLNINTFWEDAFFHTDHYYWNCKPEEFIYLISHAECVVTNSFHGLSFSMIFNRPAIFLKRTIKAIPE